MANLSAAIQHIRRARRKVREAPSQNFDRYRQEYEVILETTAALAGDSAFDEVKEWMIATTKERHQLPTPDEVRTKARDICGGHGVTVPQNSLLRE